MFTQEFRLVVWLHVRPENEPEKNWSVHILLGFWTNQKKKFALVRLMPKSAYLLRNGLEQEACILLCKCSYVLHTVVMPSSCGMFVYRLVTSIDTRMVFSGTSAFSGKLKKSVV